jgi:hypothetical protein
MKTSKSQNRKKARKIEYLDSIPNKYCIFCEGTQTEPLYFKGFEAAIESNPIYKNVVRIEICGVGAETLRVIYAAESYVRENQITKANIWCVYDKDSFPAQDFNAVSFRVAMLNASQNDVRYNVAWSNQCVEYWFILHFGFYYADNDRKYYRKFLHKIFAELGWTRYEKNNAELFNILTQHGNPKQAIKWAQKRLDKCEGLSDSGSAPATKVHLLVQELARYLPEEIRSKYL